MEVVLGRHDFWHEVVEVWAGIVAGRGEGN
jgi:hypothetical protein